MTVCTSVTTARDVIVAPEMAATVPLSFVSARPIALADEDCQRQAPSVMSAALAPRPEVSECLVMYTPVQL